MTQAPRFVALAAAARARMPHLGPFVRRVLSRAIALRLPQTAGSLAFLSMFAFVPVATIGLAVLTALPAFERLRLAVQGFLAANLFLPTFSDTVVRYVNVFAAKAGGLSALGLGVFLATAVTSLFTIEKTLNAIWDARPRRSWVQRLGLYWLMLTMAPPLLGASLALESYVWTLSLSLAGELRVAQRVWVSILPMLLTVAVLSVLYRLLPGARVRWAHAGVGALAAATVLQLWKGALGWYIAKFPTFTVVYGAFAALPALLSWLYLLWLTVLLGAVIAAQARYWGHPPPRGAPPSPAERFAFGRAVLAMLAGAEPAPAPGPAERDTSGVWLPAARFAPLFHGDAADARATAELLEAAGYIRRLVPLSVSGDSIEPWDECWVLAQPPSRLTLRALHDAIWQGLPWPATSAAAIGRMPVPPARLPQDRELDAPLDGAARGQAGRGGGGEPAGEGLPAWAPPAVVPVRG